MNSDGARRALEVRLAELLSRARHVGAELSAPHSQDSEEAAIELEAEEALIGQGVLIDKEIAEIRAALERIAAGTYGDCVTCGEPIASVRLMAIPEAAQCITCAATGAAH